MVDTEWGGEVEIVATEDVSMLLWPGMKLEASVVLDPLGAPSKAGTQAGMLNLKLGDQQRQLPVVLAESLDKPSLFWRLGRF
jgi:hypothetical protein